ncbi:MAG: TonB family protein [Rhodocyclaceae bacterium]|nr:TonB family protein [Rhodocyclaceae bacterium]
MATMIGHHYSAGDRLLPALVLSLVLHALLFFPWRWPTAARPPAPLEVSLPPLSAAPALATLPRPEPLPTEAEGGGAPTIPQQAVPLAPTLRTPKPRPLTGQALSAALAALTQEEFYPRAAIEQGLEGRVVLLLSLDAAGRVRGVTVAASSGHLLLDDAAVRAASRIGALPLSAGEALLPVEFRLE